MKAVYDTCLYIDLLRASKRIDLFSDRDHLRYLSPIVLMEIMAGVTKVKQKKIVDQLLASYLQAHRVLLLTANHYYQAGICAAALKTCGEWRHKYLTHDILIALSAKSIGAVLFTNNKKDFQVIARHIDFKVEYV